MKLTNNKSNQTGHKAGMPVRQKGLSRRREDGMENDVLSGYPEYPDNEDIYSMGREEKDIDPEDVSKTKESDYRTGGENKKYLHEDENENELDVPGAELDDNQENIGSEDEENNYYSLGGDNHNDLEEDKGD